MKTQTNNCPNCLCPLLVDEVGDYHCPVCGLGFEKENKITLTEEQENEIGAKLAEIFLLKKSRKNPDRYLLGGGYIDKTNIGLTRVFLDLADQIRMEGKLK